MENQRLEVEIQAAHKRTRETCGPERLQKDLAAHGVINRALSDQAHTPKVGDKVQTEEAIQSYHQFQ